MQDQIESPLIHLLEAFIQQERSHQHEIQELRESHQHEIRELRECHQHEIRELKKQASNKDDKIMELECLANPNSSEGTAICNSEFE